MTVRYSAAEQAHLQSEEARLQVAFWDTPTRNWENVPTVVDVSNREATVVLDHFTEFVVMATGTSEHTFMPIIIR